MGESKKMALPSRLLSLLPILCVLLFNQPCNGASASAHTTARPYSARMADSIISRRQAILENQTDSSLLLQVGIFQTALLDLIESPSGRYMEQNWKIYLSGSGDSVIDVVNNATNDVKLPLDRLSVGRGLLYLYDDTGNNTYKKTLTALRTSIDLQPRNMFGGLWYYVYPNWSYLDGMFSLLSFYPLYTSTFDINNMTDVNNDLFHQLELLWEHCYDNATGLLFHGYDATKTASWANPKSGASPIVWDRALGWFMMGLVDLLELPLMDSRVATWRARFVDLADAVVQAVDPTSGGWWQVMSFPGRTGNYIESSGSAMFTYALYKGVRLGLLQDTNPQESLSQKPISHLRTNYTSIATRAYRTLVDRFVVENPDGTLSYNGTVSVCSLNSTASYEYYIGQPLLYNSVLGSASFVRASTEHELKHGPLYEQ